MSYILTTKTLGIVGLSAISGGAAYGTGLFTVSRPEKTANNETKLQNELTAGEKELNAIEDQWKALIQDIVNRRGIFSKSEMEKFCNEKTTNPEPVKIFGNSTYKWDHKVETAECIKRQGKKEAGDKPFEYDQTILKYEMKASKTISEPRSPSLKK